VSGSTYDKAVSLLATGRDRHALVMVGCDIAAALERLTDAVTKRPVIVISTPAEGDDLVEVGRQLAAAMRGETLPAAPTAAATVPGPKAARRS